MPRLIWFFDFFGFKVQSEIPTNIGRIDAVWKLSDITVIVEVKYSVDENLDKLLNEASKQIKLFFY
ncbi:MAG: PD-(D/E)XK nuclease domain-containing protein [Planctomycetaceae bacterium]|nr:PD-(D/E)XK nuclease domain-containing protein [Planctomycetaceae bacterium]